MKLQREIERFYRRARPLDSRDGDALLRDMMAVCGDDACQRATPIPCGTPTQAGGWADDETSMRTLRFLLRMLERTRRR